MLQSYPIRFFMSSAFVVSLACARRAPGHCVETRSQLARALSPIPLRRPAAPIASLQSLSSRRLAHSHAAPINMSLSDVKGMKDLDGNPVDFGSMQGKVVLAMNVACQCGYTKSGYTMVSNVAKKLGDRVRIVCFPSNDFGAQEPGSPEEIKNFVKSKFDNPDLVLMEKTHVKGAEANPVFKLAKEAGFGEPRWNFDGKVVFDKSGKPVERLDNSAPESDILAAIQKHM